MLEIMKKNGKKEHADEKVDDVVVTTTPVVKVIELVGTSSEGFDEAIAHAVSLAGKSLHGITGADVKHMTVAVKDGKITQYRVNVKVAFAIDEDEDDD
jgi:flavin-binding protein dodecin